MLGHFPHFRFYSMDFEFFFLAHINMQYLKCSLHVPLNNTKSFEKMNFTVHNFFLFRFAYRCVIKIRYI